MFFSEDFSKMVPDPFGDIMSVFLVHMLALAGIEILIGLTVIGTLLATIGFFIGDLREKKATETQPEKSSDEKKDVKARPLVVLPSVQIDCEWHKMLWKPPARAEKETV